MPDIDAGTSLSSPDSAAGGGGDTQPVPIELSDDSYVRVPGIDKPVKVGEHFGGLKSNLTRAQQEAARLRTEQVGWQREKQGYEQKLRDLTSRGQQAARDGDRNKLVDSVKGLAYLTGKDAADIIEHLQGQNTQFGSALGQRDLAIVALAKEVANLRKVANQFTTQSTTQAFEGRINKVAKDLGVPDRVIPRLQELYLSYEPGEALDREFPTIAKSWWEDISATVDEARKSRLQAARSTPFVPGKGGTAGPTKPLDTSKMGLDELVDKFFPMVEESRSSA